MDCSTPRAAVRGDSLRNGRPVESVTYKNIRLGKELFVANQSSGCVLGAISVKTAIENYSKPALTHQIGH